MCETYGIYWPSMIFNEQHIRRNRMNLFGKLTREEISLVYFQEGHPKDQTIIDYTESMVKSGYIECFKMF